MTIKTTHEPGTVYDLEAALRQLKGDPTYQRGHIARTLARLPDLRMVLIAIQGGHEIPEHDADDSVTIQVVSGRVQLVFEGREVELGAGQLITLEGGVPHSVRALEESALLLSLGWHKER